MTSRCLGYGRVRKDCDEEGSAAGYGVFVYAEWWCSSGSSDSSLAKDLHVAPSYRTVVNTVILLPTPPFTVSDCPKIYPSLLAMYACAGNYPGNRASRSSSSTFSGYSLQIATLAPEFTPYSVYHNYEVGERALSVSQALGSICVGLGHEVRAWYYATTFGHLGLSSL